MACFTVCLKKVNRKGALDEGYEPKYCSLRTSQWPWIGEGQFLLQWHQTCVGVRGQEKSMLYREMRPEGLPVVPATPEEDLRSGIFDAASK